MTKIYYFSATGNTLWSAKRMAEVIGGDCELVSIGIEAQKETVIIEADAVVLLFPSYAYGLPVIVRRFIKGAVFKTPYLAAFVTFGTSPGGSLAAARRILKKKNINAVYYGKIPSVENFLALFGPPKEKITQKRLAMHRESTFTAVRCVLERQVNRVFTIRPFSAFVSVLFSLAVKIFYKKYRLSDNCNGCGLCEKVCPVSAIVMREGRPVFSDKCELCQGCLHWCPLKAISFGRMNSNCPRYHHPEITIADIERV